MEITPREAIAAEVTGTLSLWEHGRDLPTLGPRTARDVLALWAELGFRMAGEPGEREARLEHVVKTQTDGLVAESLRHAYATFPDGWCGAVAALSGRLDRGEEGADYAASLLFQELDRSQLALWAAGRLAPDRDVRGAAGRVEQALAVFRHDVTPWVCRGDEMKQVLDAARRDLEEAEPELAATLEKHRMVWRAYQWSRTVQKPV